MNMQPPATWTAKQEKLALLIAAGATIKGAAADCGIGERTAHIWIRIPGYASLVAELRGRILDEALGKLAGAAVASVETLRALLDDPSASVRLRASQAILDSLIKIREHTELDRRLMALEHGGDDGEADDWPAQGP
jgi:hypothetical protein